jgi:hypothetical protein
MPGSASNSDVLQQTVNGFAQRVQEYADGIAGRLGQPMSGTQLSQQDAVQRWNFSPLGNTQAADAAYHQLVAQGTPPGKALDQVYPMRSMLFQGADLTEAIGNARKIAGWAADATGQAPPQEPQGSTLPMLMAMQQGATQAPPPLPGAPMAGLPPMPSGDAPVQPMGMPGPAPMPMPQGPMPGIPAMAGGGVVTQPTVALIGEAGPEAVVPLNGAPGPSAVLQPVPTPTPAPMLDPDLAARLGNTPVTGPPGPNVVTPPTATPDEIQAYIVQAAQQRGIDPSVALRVAQHEGFATGQAAQQGTFATGRSWWPFQLHYGGPGYEQYGNVAGLGNDFTAATGWQPGDPRAWRDATDFALDTAVQRGWYPTFYGSVPAGVAPRQGLPAPPTARKAA